MRQGVVYFFLLFFLISGPACSQIGGTAVYRFLSLSPSPVQTALGGKQFVSFPGQILQNFSNPALIVVSDRHTVGINYTHYITDINYGQLGYTWQTGKAGTFFTGITYLNYGRFTAADADGNRTGTFGASETVFQAGYGYRISGKWYGGISVKGIYSQLESYRSTGLAADISLTYHDTLTDAAFLVRNAGFQLTTYNGSREPLPFEIALSYARLLEHAPLRLFVTFENLQVPAIAFVNPAHSQIDPDGNVQEETIRFYHHIFRHLITGAEIFPRKRFRLRIGFNFRRAAELGLQDVNFSSGMSYGFGLRLRKWAVDYGYGQYHFAGNTHHVGIHFYLHPKTATREKN